MYRYFILFLVSATSSWAGSVSFSVEGASSYALRHNPDLATARLRIDEARGRLLQSGRLANPEVEIDYGHNIRSREDSFGASLLQKFPLTRRLRLEKAVSAAQLAAAEAEVRNAERKLVLEVQLAAVKLLALREQQTLFDSQVTNSRELVEFLANRVQVGEASVVEAGQVELETQQLRVELLQLAVTRVELETELRPLLGISAGSIDITGGLPSPRSAGGAGRERPDLEAARYQAEAAAHEARLARANRWEDIGIGVFAQHGLEEDAPEGLERETMLGFKISLALPFWNRNQGRIQETVAAEARARKEADALASRIHAETSGAQDEMSILAGLIGELDTTLLPKAAELEDLLRNAYSKGQSPLTEVLRARDKRLLLQRQCADALRKYHLARVRHAAATGAILPRSSKTKGTSGK